jgi:hypothetical protein
VSKRREEWPRCSASQKGRLCPTIVESVRDQQTGKASPAEHGLCAFHAVRARLVAEDAASTEPARKSSRISGNRGARVIASGRIAEDGSDVPDPGSAAA